MHTRERERGGGEKGREREREKLKLISFNSFLIIKVFSFIEEIYYSEKKK